MKSTNLQEIFKKFRVLTLNHVSEINKCSIRTVQRQFAELAVLRSYNKNSRYYTLPNIPKFNIYGIWNYQDIYFSKYGNLRKTVKHLIISSEQGLSGNDIGAIIGLLPRSFMHHFQETEDISREKYEGVYVYFSNDPAIYIKQKSKRIQIIDLQRISDAVAVKILVEYIKQPELPVEELSIFLQQQENCYVVPITITKFLSFHGLLKKTLAF